MFLETDNKCKKDYAKYDKCSQTIFGDVAESVRIYRSRDVEAVVAEVTEELKEVKEKTNCTAANSLFAKLAPQEETLDLFQSEIDEEQ